MLKARTLDFPAFLINDNILLNSLCLSVNCEFNG